MPIHRQRLHLRTCCPLSLRAAVLLLRFLPLPPVLGATCGQMNDHRMITQGLLETAMAGCFSLFTKMETERQVYMLVMNYDSITVWDCRWQR